MNTHFIVKSAIAVVAAVIGTAQLSADIVETRNGARIVGKIVGIENGAVIVDTEYADTITIKQSQVSALTTDAPVAVRLLSGTRVEGRVSGTSESLRIDSADGPISTTVAQVDASWAAGGRDPQLVALERRWAFEASVDISGKSGNSSQLGTAAAFRATLAGRTDILMFYTSYDRQVTDDEKSADQFKAGVDYSNNFSGKYSWYVRDEGGFDRVKGIQFYNVAAAGLGYDVIKDDAQTLTGRVGISFRNEDYEDPLTDDVKDAGLDFGLSHSLQRDNWSVVNRLAFVPSFNDFGNFRLTHESFFEIPLANPRWKLRLGLANDYNSRPGDGVEKLDTSYFTRFVLNWK